MLSHVWVKAYHIPGNFCDGLINIFRGDFRKKFPRFIIIAYVYVMWNI